MNASKYLSIYVNDHLAALAALRDVARRSARSNEGSDLGVFLAGVASDLEGARAELERVAAGLGIRRDPLKRAAAWAAEKAGRLKLNGHLIRYSPLSRVLELEGLTAGADVELATWRSLGRVTQHDFSGLIERCERNRDTLVEHHAAAVAVALGGTSSQTR